MAKVVGKNINPEESLKNSIDDLVKQLSNNVSEEKNRIDNSSKLLGNKIEGLEELFKKFIFDFNQILTKQENNTELLNQKWDEAIRSNSEFNGKVSDVTSELKEGVPMMKQAAENINQAASKLGTFQESLSIEIDKFQKEFSEIRNAMNLAAGEISNSTDKLGEIPQNHGFRH